jgi:long-chain acyl-CoA synthetase
MNFKPGAPINFSSVRDILETNEKIYGLKPSVITVNPHTLESFSINYSELKSVVFNTAAWLEKLGIRKGDRFSILMHNTAEVLIFELAGALIGATAVPLDSKRDTLERKLFKIKQTRSKALFETVGDESAQDIEEIKKKFPEVAVIGWSNFEEFKKLIGSGLPGNIYEGLDKHYVILYTSGTTNMPKGVPLKASSCLLNAAGIAKWQKFTEEDVFNLVLPLHHINSTIFALALIISGGSIVMNTTYSASGFWKVIEKFGCTNSSIVPTILHDLLVRVNEYRELKPDTSSLKRICIGSAPVLPDQTLKFADTFKVRVIQGYGQTETALRVTGVPVDLEDDSYKEMVRLNSTGLALANCEVDILDENNNPKKEGEEGEVCISGPVLGDGY